MSGSITDQGTFLSILSGLLVPNGFATPRHWRSPVWNFKRVSPYPKWHLRVRH